MSEVEVKRPWSAAEWSEAAQGHVWTFVMVSPEPLYCEILNFLDGLKQVLAQPVVTHCPVIALDVGILLRLTGVDLLDAYTPPCRPVQQCCADVL